MGHSEGVNAPRVVRVCAMYLAVVAVVLSAAGCSRSGQDSTTNASRPDSSVPGPDAANPDADATAPDSTEPVTGHGDRVELVRVASGLEEPTDVIGFPGIAGALLVAEKAGVVRLLVPAPQDPPMMTLVEEPVLDLRDEVGDADSELGLLGLAIDDTASRLFVSYTATPPLESRVEEYSLNRGDATGDDRRDDRADLTGDTVAAGAVPVRRLLTVAQPQRNHNGGDLEFGPDGMLYLGLGDGGGAGDPRGHAQDPDSYLGKLLRLDPDGEDHNGSRQTASDVEIWASGLRNPWRFTFDDASGDLWIADVGQNRWEEVNRLSGPRPRRGANFGWNVLEGTEVYEGGPGGNTAAGATFVDPVHTYGRENGCSITGGVVVRSSDLPSLDGAYLFADFCTEGLSALVEDSGSYTARRLDVPLRSATAFGTDDDGAVHIVTIDGDVFRLRSPLP